MLAANVGGNIRWLCTYSCGSKQECICSSCKVDASHGARNTTLPSALQAANTVEAKGAHTMSHTTLLKSKVNTGFLEQETHDMHTCTDVKSEERGGR